MSQEWQDLECALYLPFSYILRKVDDPSFKLGADA